jgi:Flp pilus assembly protein TadG
MKRTSAAFVLRRLGDARGQAILEFTLVVFSLLGLVFGGVSLAFGFLARSVTAAAARDAARTLAIECGQGIGTAGQDAAYSAHYDLNSGVTLVQSSFVGVTQAEDSPAPGQWGFAWSCSGGQAMAEVVYDATDLFPAIFPGGPRAFVVQAAVTFPVE